MSTFRLYRPCLRLRKALARPLSTTTPRPAGDVRIVEVGPRDGLQNEKNTISLSTKLELIDKLSRTGLHNIEAGAFVSPKWVPQMANSAEILEHILDSPLITRGNAYSFLVPNVKGLENLLAVSDANKGSKTSSSTGKYNYPTPPPSPEGTAPITSTQDPNEMPSGSTAQGEALALPIEVSVFAAATETFSRKNINCTIEESLDRFRPIMALAKTRNIRVRAYISVALGCPYEGPDVSASKVAELAATLFEMGADEISVADTTGMGTAPRTKELLRTLSASGIQNQDLAVHFHDTYGQALVNTVVALEHGIRVFDSSVAGLGGCPFSKGATGNVATEDLLHCLHSLGAKTGVDVEKVAEIGAWISDELGRPNESRAGKAILARRAQ
ncbi:pyruvate carboxyltransferase [Xylona heveae TC161]|uniref:hydroxymethylglutaryl-CoA lyase n=1 Tax=Xylona heveae (strain CBS 132557 / TC161) TaxID=1328760 RepID=A0A165A2T2_XYLHT|nr:pyruvate carboxyltransferase [Xylona heveae TC161]KZF19876.1 pyruvate carboxyltransferase [Xylona heveae TC161]